MRKFQFQFAVVLKQRKAREEDALRALGGAQRAYQEEISRKRKLLRDLEQSLIRREELGRVAAPPLAFQLESEFISGQKARITRQDQAIVRASRAVEKALRAFLIARRQTRTMELLREKAYAKYRKARSKWEQRLQDDMTVMRARLKAEEENWGAVS